jgi:integrase
MIERHILPALGRRKLADANRADVQRLHHKLRETPFYANRVLALLSKIFNLAEAWGLRPDGTNPCRHVTRYKEPARARFVSEVELARLGAVLAQAEHEGTEAPAAIAAVRLLVLTGCRLGEILTLRWEHADLERGELRLPESKTGPKTVPLNAPARELLAGLARDQSGFVIPGRKRGRHLVNLEKPWCRLRERAGLADVRLHDLRHSFASIGAGGGLSLPVIGALLGHTQAATTKKYAHLADDPLRAASELIGRRIAAAWGTKGGEVVALSLKR